MCPVHSSHWPLARLLYFIVAVLAFAARVYCVQTHPGHCFCCLHIILYLIFTQGTLTLFAYWLTLRQTNESGCGSKWVAFLCLLIDIHPHPPFDPCQFSLFSFTFLTFCFSSFYTPFPVSMATNRTQTQTLTHTHIQTFAFTHSLALVKCHCHSYFANFTAWKMYLCETAVEAASVFIARAKSAITDTDTSTSTNTHWNTQTHAKWMKERKKERKRGAKGNWVKAISKKQTRVRMIADEKRMRNTRFASVGLQE